MRKKEKKNKRKQITSSDCVRNVATATSLAAPLGGRRVNERGGNEEATSGDKFYNKEKKN